MLFGILIKNKEASKVMVNRSNFVDY